MILTLCHSCAHTMAFATDTFCMYSSSSPKGFRTKSSGERLVCDLIVLHFLWNADIEYKDITFSVVIVFIRLCNTFVVDITEVGKHMIEFDGDIQEQVFKTYEK